MYPRKVQTRQRYALSSMLFQIVLEVLDNVISLEKRARSINAAHR